MKKLNVVLRVTFMIWILVAVSISYSISQEVTIGNQVWMVKNLDVDRFRNGDPIPQAKSNEEWREAAANNQPAWCYYDNDPGNGARYGKLYNWYAVNENRGLAPEGWQIPSVKVWAELSDHLGGDYVAGGRLKGDEIHSMESSSNESIEKSGFNALPGGARLNDGRFVNIEKFGNWWSSTGEKDRILYEVYSAWYCYLNFDYNSLNRLDISPAYGYSVRCVKNSNGLQEKNAKGGGFDPYGSDESLGDSPGEIGTEVLGEGIFGRKVIYRPDVSRMSPMNGTIAIKICVNRAGNVTEASCLPQGSSITDPTQIKRAEDIASKYRFEPERSGPPLQCGMLTFKFTVKD